MRRPLTLRGLLFCLSGGLMMPMGSALASSHREAPFITTQPKLDGTDFYMFRSYEPGRGDFVTFIANYLPLQDPYGGPNYFFLDENARYEIHVDNNGDSVEDISFQFEFNNSFRNIALDVGGKSIPVPVLNVGQAGVDGDRDDTGNLNVQETYQVRMLENGKVSKDGSKKSTLGFLTDADIGASTFLKPVDNIGSKTLPDYAAYANSHIHTVEIPDCGTGRVFAGQRREGFVVNLGEIFDLVNTDPLGPPDGEANILDDKNVTALALEVPIACLVDEDPVIGAWTTASRRQVQVVNLPPRPKAIHKSFQAEFHVGRFVQISRLGHPLVNEVVIGLPDKDRFNASQPKNDAQFLDYVTNPTLPVLLNVLFGVTPPTTPRDDLVSIFLTGIDGLNQPSGVIPSEQLRLNTSILPTAGGSQNRLGVLGGDVAGYPNGRRPGDDVVDIALRAVMGAVRADAGDPGGSAPSGDLALVDGAFVDDSFFDTAFPYLVTPLPGSPN